MSSQHTGTRRNPQKHTSCVTSFEWSLRAHWHHGSSAGGRPGKWPLNSRMRLNSKASDARRHVQYVPCRQALYAPLIPTRPGNFFSHARGWHTVHGRTFGEQRWSELAVALERARGLGPWVQSRS